DQSSLEFFPGLEARLEDRREIPLSAANRFVRPEDLDATVAEPGPVSWIVFLGADRAGAPRLEPIASAAAVAELARNAFNVHVYGGAGVLLLSRLAREATSYVLHGGSPGERAEFLAERLR